MGPRIVNVGRVLQLVIVVNEVLTQRSYRCLEFNLEIAGDENTQASNTELAAD